MTNTSNIQRIFFFVLTCEFNLGLSYYTKLKKIAARKVSRWSCRCKCSNQLNTPTKQKLFDSFNSLENHVLQNQYLKGCISVHEVSLHAYVAFLSTVVHGYENKQLSYEYA